MPPSVVVSGLSKVFRARKRAQGLGGSLRQLIRPETHEVVALDGLSFRIEEGERVAFVGPNGAGKSTTIKILTGILHPSGGEAQVLGEVPWKSREKLAYRLGTVFGQRTQLWYHLPAADTFDLLARIYELDDAAYRGRRGELVEAFELAPLLEKPVRQLSLGERMRCEVVASLLHAPDVLFLDEPTIGLDVTAKATIRDLVHDMSVRDGSTVLLTSHDTGDMERVCDRVIVINHGKLLLDEPVASLRQNYIKRKRVTLLTAEPDVAIEMEGVERVEHAPHRTVLEVDTTKAPVEAVVAAALAASRLRDLTVEDPPMEEIVKAIYAAS
jgi:ABC-2 type transport system ATP-binding protein